MLPIALLLGSRHPWSWRIEYANYFQMLPLDNIPRFFIKPDGMELYALFASDIVKQYTLSTAWDISSATYTAECDVGVEIDSGNSPFFKPDGTEMYISDSLGDIVQYTLSIPWDIESATYTRTLDISGSVNWLSGIFFNPDGTAMYISNTYPETEGIRQYTLSTAWDISSATYTKMLDLSATSTSVAGLYFRSNGMELYLIELDDVDRVRQFDLSTPWDISTATHDQYFAISTEVPYAYSLFFRANGRSFYVGGAGVSGIGVSDGIYQYNM